MNIIKYFKNYNSSIYDFRLRKMSRLAKNYSSVLDIGFAENPNIHLNNKHVTGFDIKPTEKPANYHHVITGDVMELSSLVKHNFFDAIYCGELLEHLQEPMGFLRECHKVLNLNGRIILSTPNPHSFMEIFLTIFLIKKIFYTYEHVCLYPQRWLIRMFERSGFKNVKVHGGGLKIPYLGTIPFLRTFGNYTIIVAVK